MKKADREYIVQELCCKDFCEYLGHVELDKYIR